MENKYLYLKTRSVADDWVAPDSEMIELELSEAYLEELLGYFLTFIRLREEFPRLQEMVINEKHARWFTSVGAIQHNFDYSEALMYDEMPLFVPDCLSDPRKEMSDTTSYIHITSEYAYYTMRHKWSVADETSIRLERKLIADMWKAMHTHQEETEN